MDYEMRFESHRLRDSQDQWRRQDFKSGGARLKNKIESKINLRNINRYY